MSPGRPAEPAPRGLRPVPFAWRLVVHRKTRTAVAATGIGFAVLVLFMQLGFYSAVTNTALAVSDRLNGDLLLVSSRFVRLTETGTIPRGRLFQSLTLPEVESAIPLYFRYATWRDPSTSETCRLFALAFPVAEARKVLPISIPELAPQLDAIKPTNTVLLDRLTQSECGPRDPNEVEVRDQAIRVVGYFDLGVGFLADGALLMSDDTFSNLFRSDSLDWPHLGLIRLHPGSDAREVAARLEASLPRDVRVISKQDLNQMQVRQWVENTAVGNIFGMGTVAGFLVGVVVLYQILSTDIRTHLPLYATLKAMGYGNRRLMHYVLEQAWIFAGLGFLPALCLTLIVFPLIHSLTRLPIYLTPGLAIFVLALAFGMCSLAALLSAQRLRRADPAELF